MDSNDESQYRLNLSREHLSHAQKMFDEGEWVLCAHEAQLAVENAAKAIVACYKIPPYAHMVKDEMDEFVSKYRDQLGNLVDEIIKVGRYSEELEETHWLTNYGKKEGDKFLLPSQIYNKEKAKNALDKADESVRIASECLKKWFNRNI